MMDTGGIYIEATAECQRLKEQLLACRKDVNNPNKEHRNSKDSLEQPVWQAAGNQRTNLPANQHSRCAEDQNVKPYILQDEEVEERNRDVRQRFNEYSCCISFLSCKHSLFFEQWLMHFRNTRPGTGAARTRDGAQPHPLSELNVI